MAAVHDALNSQAEADAVQRLLEGCTDRYQDEETPPPLGLVVGLAAVAICDRLNALTMRLGYELEASRASE